MTRPNLVATAALGLALLTSEARPCFAGEPPPCSALEPEVVVATRDHALWLCESGRPVASYRVAIGRGGTGKRVQGDNKTPLGSYPLGDPRPSSRFGIFIPIAYPTPEQRIHGFTGADVGIHGPDRRFRWAGSLSTSVDWTAGCVALGTDDEAQAVASWVRKRSPSVTIR